MQTLTSSLIISLISNLVSYIRLRYLSKFVLVTFFLVFQSANAAGYLFHYGSDDYDTLGEAESAMRSNGTSGSDRLVRYETKENPSTGEIIYRYNVPGFPMIAIAPEFFFTGAACDGFDDICLSEGSAKEAHIDAQYLNYARYGTTLCDVQLTP
jgi:hypothetical protein